MNKIMLNVIKTGLLLVVVSSLSACYSSGMLYPPGDNTVYYPTSTVVHTWPRGGHYGPPHRPHRSVVHVFPVTQPTSGGHYGPPSTPSSGGHYGPPSTPSAGGHYGPTTSGNSVVHVYPVDSHQNMGHYGKPM